MGDDIPKTLGYVTNYNPVPIDPYPDRVWIIHRDGFPFCTFTNMGEAWLLLLALNSYEEEEYMLEYAEV